MLRFNHNTVSNKQAGDFPQRQASDICVEADSEQIRPFRLCCDLANWRYTGEEHHDPGIRRVGACHTVRLSHVSAFTVKRYTCLAWSFDME
jgi:hypothetical protein